MDVQLKGLKHYQTRQLIKAPARTVLVTVVLTGPVPGYADSWEIEPSVHLSSGYHENIRLTPGPHEETAELILSGKAELRKRNETSNIIGRVRLDYTGYSGDDLVERQNSDNQLLGLFISKNIERDGFKLNGHFRRDTTLKTLSGVIEDPDQPVPARDINADEGLITSNVRRNELNLAPSWQRGLTEKSWIGVNYRFSDVEYDDVSSGLNDYSLYSLEGKYGRNLSPITKLSLSFSGSHFDSDTAGSEYDLLGFAVDFYKNFTETLQAGVNVGIQHLSFETNTESDDNYGFSLALISQKQTELSTYRGRITRSLEPSGAGEVVWSNIADLLFARKLTPRSNVTLDLIFKQTSSTRPGGQEKTRYFRVKPSIAWTLTPHWSLSAAYEYRANEFVDSGTDVDSNAVFLSIHYMRPTILD